MYLDSLQSTNIKLGLERVFKACEALDHPENKFPSIIIAGTNGKGSTSAFLESILRHHGLKAGLYTSPHLVDVRERIQINREMISEDDFTRLIAKVKDVNSPTHQLTNSLTYFEFLAVMGVLYFAEQKVDIAVLEVGLGGRLDATNVVTPLVSVITRIGIDHKGYLGDTVEKIAFEKCGIIKKGVPVVTIDQSSEVMDVIRRVADENDSMLHIVSPNEVKWRLGLSGRHQLENAACAVRAAEIVLEGEVESVFATALASTVWPGRLEIVSQKPLVILDGAHNPNGAAVLARHIKETYPNRHKIILMGVMADKDIEGIVKPLLEVADEFIATRPAIPRAAEPKKIANLKKTIKIIEPASVAIRETIKKMSQDSALIITGSLYMVGEARRFL